MINLLPPVALQNFIQEYRRRRALYVEWLVLCLLMVAAIVGLIFLFSLEVRARGVEAELARREAEVAKIISPEQRQQIAAFEARLGVVVKAVAPDESLAVIIDQVYRHVHPGIKLSSLTYERQTETAATLRLHGIAATRGDLLTFITSLQAEPFFAVIDSPVSNLIRDRGATFSLSITLNFTKRAP